jgi:hypothetical protein
MSDLGGDRAADPAIHAASRRQAGARYAVLALIVVSIAGGLWSRSQGRASAELVSPERLGAALTRAQLPPVGAFTEPTAGLRGFEIALPGCPEPLGMLPVISWNTEIAPESFRYRDGAYSVSYVYDGTAYPEASIGFRLGALSLYRRFVALVSFADARRYAYYFKVWTPAGCAGLTAADLERLRDAD